MISHRYTQNMNPLVQDFWALTLLYHCLPYRLYQELFIIEVQVSFSILKLVLQRLKLPWMYFGTEENDDWFIEKLYKSTLSSDIRASVSVLNAL